MFLAGMLNKDPLQSARFSVLVHQRMEHLAEEKQCTCKDRIHQRPVPRELAFSPAVGVVQLSAYLLISVNLVEAGMAMVAEPLEVQLLEVEEVVLM